MFLEELKKAVVEIQNISEKRPIKVISHFDTDGITSATIFTKALQRKNIKFSLQILKSLDEEYIKNLSDEQTIIFLDLASNSLEHLKDKKTDIFIFDHHEIIQEIPSHVRMINPTLDGSEQICSSAIAYLFAKNLSESNKDLANISLLGMIGDNHEKNLGKIYSEIIQDSEAVIKKGILIYPSTRPLDRVLEYCSNPYIPGVSGSYSGVLELLRDAKITKQNNTFKSIHELNEEEMINLVTAIMLRIIGRKASEELIGNIYLIKFFNKLEDARELSAMINACSRMDSPETAIGFCMGSRIFKEKAEKLYINYRQHIISALKYIQESEKITGNKYTIINAKDKIKDTIIGTVASIISHSKTYEEGTMIIALAYNNDKIKVSARISGKEGRNAREILNKIVVPLGGEVGGHPSAAGCMISKEKEGIFIEELVKVLEIEQIKTNNKV